MFAFLIKKTFFDMWDNLLRIILLNLGFYPFLVLIYPLRVFSVSLEQPSVVSYLIGFAALFVGLAPLLAYIGAASGVCSDIADYKSPGFRDFWSHLKRSYGSSILLALVIAGYVTVIAVAMPFYAPNFIKSDGEKYLLSLTVQSVLTGILPFGLILAILVYTLLSIQYFFPIQSRLDTKLRKIARKSLLVFFDNPGFSILLLLCVMPMLVAIRYVPAIVMFFGPAIMLLWWNVAFKLRLYKYDYLEANPGAKRRGIPWDALLVEDRERVGKRTLRGMIFPWKE